MHLMSYMEPLLERLRRRDPDAFQEVLLRFGGPIHRTLFHLLHDSAEAEDLVQESFTLLFLKVDAVRAIRPWLYRVALNLARMRLRRRKPLALAKALAVPESSPDLRELIALALDTLSEKLRTTFLLHEVGGLATTEIAEAEGCSPEAVRQRLVEARRKLRQTLGPRLRTPDFLGV